MLVGTFVQFQEYEKLVGGKVVFSRWGTHNAPSQDSGFVRSALAIKDGQGIVFSFVEPRPTVIAFLAVYSDAVEVADIS